MLEILQHIVGLWKSSRELIVTIVIAFKCYFI